MTFSLKRHLERKTTHFRKDEDGVAAIEFALIAPVMIIMYFGLAEMATAISVDRRISHGANVAADLVTQNAEMTAEDIEEALAAAVRVMGVSNASKVTIDMRSYVKDADGNVTSEGIVQLNSSANNLPTFTPASLDERILNSNSGVVVTRVAYTYTPLELQHFNSDITLKETFMLKPRRSDTVILGSDAGKDVTCSAAGFASVSCSGADST